jgi:iron complex transport system substrate-binding protein
VILVTENDLALFGGQAGLWRAYPTLRQTPAGAANRVWVMPDVELKSASVASGSGAVALAAAFATVPRP